MRATVQTVPKVEYQRVNVKRRKRIGLYGGTFNPVHNAHLLVADQVGRTLGLDKVLLMPDMIPPHVDKKSAIAAKLRVEMLQLAIHGNPFLGLELTEIERGGVSYTFDTIRELKQHHPDVDYYFIIGGDMVDYLPKWYRIQDLLKIVNFVGVHRPGARNHSEFPVIWVDVPEVDFSSSDIRQRIHDGRSIKYMVPEKVEQYIKEHQLYID
ncbi:nicotinate-nucleotide adenylyltransferase [uncultured Limosilactobacillus sp.]|uniref:nicotinate-nucleotide adenylyltransferase n=1 Tax=uncultured Limosilactobacillus sp. TaxID=2837629 RepID=UPI0025EF4BD8|nr:nicotinate-nucleotide adenylyltransferase [uncultured Limosilactobacillus sp.]